MSWASWAAGTIRTATAIAREMKDRTEQDRRDPRPAGGAGSGARRPVKRAEVGFAFPTDGANAEIPTTWNKTAHSCKNGPPK